MSKASDAWWIRTFGSIDKGPDSVPKGQGPAAELLQHRWEAVAPDAPDDVYDPTSSSNPDDPRTSAMEYFEDSEVVIVHWGDQGVDYGYSGVTPALWQSWKRTGSPGRWINRHPELQYWRM